MSENPIGGGAPETDVFAYHNSGLEPFLFAEIGVDRSGLSITVLSALARNEVDPWGKAAQWARVPRAEVIDQLAADIARLPLARATDDDDRETAARLVDLLPSAAQAPKSSLGTGWASPRWGAMMLLAGGIIVVAAMAAVFLHPNTTVDHRRSTLPAAPPVKTDH